MFYLCYDNKPRVKPNITIHKGTNLDFLNQTTNSSQAFPGTHGNN